MYARWSTKDDFLDACGNCRSNGHHHCGNQSKAARRNINACTVYGNVLLPRKKTGFKFNFKIIKGFPLFFCKTYGKITAVAKGIVKIRIFFLHFFRSGLEFRLRDLKRRWRSNVKPGCIFSYSGISV